MVLALLFQAQVLIFSSPIYTLPSMGSSNPTNVFINVNFPEPLGPKKQIISPGFPLKDTFNYRFILVSTT